ncbi:MAG: hypothetical protein ACLPX9_16535 [Rhodomicrobium sp.]
MTARSPRFAGRIEKRLDPVDAQAPAHFSQLLSNRPDCQSKQFRR